MPVTPAVPPWVMERAGKLWNRALQRNQCEALLRCYQGFTEQLVRDFALMPWHELGEMTQREVASQLHKIADAWNRSA